MNILGLCGSIGWDGNIPFFVEGLNSDFWIHGSGATLIMDGELKNSMCEERFSRIKYDGAYPKLAIQTILDNNKITKHDIDVVVYVCSHIEINLALRQKGYISTKIKEYFPNCTVEYLPHHVAHAAATFYTSGFEEANILSFDGAGDHEVQPNGQLLICHFKFLSGKGSKLIEHQSAFGHYGPMDNSFGNIYSYFSEFAYKKKMNLAPNTGNKILEESYPGRIMGLAAYGDHTKIDIPEIFTLERNKQTYNDGWDESFPQLRCQQPSTPSHEVTALNPDDLAAWSQNQFEKYLLLFLDNIPKKFKLDNLCLGGGCALNILANSKIIEQGIYKNVHVNTAPGDDGLHFGAALSKSIEYEDTTTLPNDIGYLGITYTDEDIEEALCLNK